MLRNYLIMAEFENKLFPIAFFLMCFHLEQITESLKMQISCVLCLQQNHGDFPDGGIIYPLHSKVDPQQTKLDCGI